MTDQAQPCRGVRPKAHLRMRVGLALLVMGMLLFPQASLHPGMAWAHPSAMTPPGQAANPLLRLFPGLRDSPPPDWLHEGVRVTYRTETWSKKSQPNSFHRGWGDDTGWLVPVGYGPGSIPTSASGISYLQYDVLAIEGNTVASALKIYLDTGSGQVVPSAVTSVLGMPGAGDFWISPQALERAEEVASDELEVKRGPATVGDEEYDEVVRFEYRPRDQEPEAEFISMYEATSGLLLYHRYRKGSGADQEQESGIATLVQQRQLEVPWEAATLPKELQVGTSLNYQGSYQFVMANVPAAQLTYNMEVKVVKTHSRWLELQMTEYVSGKAGLPGRRAGSVSQMYDAVWLPPPALSALRAGQVLDQDPITGAQLVVTRKTRTLVVLTESAPAYHSSLMYSLTDGLLRAFEVESEVGLGSQLVEASLASPSQR